MILVSVGTHEQQFDRLVKQVDEWAKKHAEEVIVQLGYCNYVPKNCKYYKFIKYDDMLDLIKKARIVITHGGPASFIPVLQNNNVPIVVPRQRKFKEHVNDHQLIFCKEYNKKFENIILVENIEKLDEAISSHQNFKKRINKSNNESFCIEFEKIVNNLIN